MIEEKVMYAELRPMLLDKSIPSNDGKHFIDNPGQMRLIIAGVQEKQAELERKGELHKFPFGLKIIYCTPRSIPKQLMQAEMKHCIDLKIQFPELICGKSHKCVHVPILANTSNRLRSCRSRRPSKPYWFLQGRAHSIPENMSGLQSGNTVPVPCRRDTARYGWIIRPQQFELI